MTVESQSQHHNTAASPRSIPEEPAAVTTTVASSVVVSSSPSNKDTFTAKKHRHHLSSLSPIKTMGNAKLSLDGSQRTPDSAPDVFGRADTGADRSFANVRLSRPPSAHVHDNQSVGSVFSASLYNLIGLGQGNGATTVAAVPDPTTSFDAYREGSIVRRISFTAVANTDSRAGSRNSSSSSTFGQKQSMQTRRVSEAGKSHLSRPYDLPSPNESLQSLAPHSSRLSTREGSNSTEGKGGSAFSLQVDLGRFVSPKSPLAPEASVTDASVYTPRDSRRISASPASSNSSNDFASAIGDYGS
ncbi:hypothetical protein EV182_006021, partial [Spiromyces aspiralis]